jgi:hypothetical protein
MLREFPRRLALAVLPLIALTDIAAAHDKATFTVTIKNVATEKTLMLPDGSAVAAPIAPGIYAVVDGGISLFAEGKPVDDNGLEHLAEDGNFEPLLEHVKAMPGVHEAGMFIPGQPFELTARPGERLVFGTMFVQSNDLFFSPAPEGLPLFDATARPLVGDRTKEVRLWDAGTEINELPGTGPNQAPRQSAANTGPAEQGVVHPVEDDFAYPATTAVIRVDLAVRD